MFLYVTCYNVFHVNNVIGSNVFKSITLYSHYITFLGAALFCLFLPCSAHAHIEQLILGYSSKYFQYDQGPGAEKSGYNTENRHEDVYLYEQPTVKALSHTYWGLNVYSLTDDEAIDEFMQINECDMYTKFVGDEFEWSGIRQAAKDFILANKSDFPTRFEFVIPLKLRDYNERFAAFDVQDEFQIKSFRKFELFATDAFRKPCVKDQNLAMGYPRIVVLELSRPVTVVRVPMSVEIANEYTRKKNVQFKKKIKKVVHRTKAAMYNMRDAYLYLRVKIFAHGGLLGKSKSSRLSAIRMMGILEGYEVYADRQKTQLFYSQIFVRSKKKGKLNVKLGDQYRILEELSKSGGVLQ